MFPYSILLYCYISIFLYFYVSILLYFYIPIFLYFYISILNYIFPYFDISMFLRPWHEPSHPDDRTRGHLGFHEAFCERWLGSEEKREARTHVAKDVDMLIANAFRQVDSTGRSVELRIVFMCACLCWFQTKPSSKRVNNWLDARGRQPNHYVINY